MSTKKDKDKKIAFKNYKKLFNEAIKDLKTPGKRYKQIPNILTLSRLLSPFAIIPAALTGNIPLTITLAAVFGLTDLADGAIARNFGLQSELGAALDAVTDKVYVGTLLIASSLFNPFLLCNLALEGVIAAINIKQEMNGKKASSTKVGKVKTAAIFTLGGLGLIAPAITNLPGLLPTAAVITAAMQGLTISSYVEKYSTAEPQGKKNVQRAPEVTSPPQNKEEKSSKDLEKTIEYGSAQPIENKQPSLDEYRKMSEFLHGMQEAHTNQATNSEGLKVKEKTKSEE